MITNPNYIPPKVEGLIPDTAPIPTGLSGFGRDEEKQKSNSKEK